MKKFIFLFPLFLAACSSTTESGEVGVGRKQLILVPSEQIMQLSEQDYAKVKAEAQAQGNLDKDPAVVARLKSISQRLIPQTSVFRKDALNWKWEVHAISSEELNAYCMPGGKIIFYTGLIDKLKMTDAEIAAVMGHEISHALREHGRERMSEELLKQAGLMGLEMLVATKAVDSKYSQYLGAATIVSTVAISLPHSRRQEKEADDMGMELMARAGYDPHESITLWKKMSSSGAAKPPEILSTHPSDSNRIKDMEGLLPKTLPLFQTAKK